MRNVHFFPIDSNAFNRILWVSFGAHSILVCMFVCVSDRTINSTEARNAAIMKGIINKQREPFSVRAKDFWPVQIARNLLGEKFRASLSHEPDGLIFQPSLDVIILLLVETRVTKFYQAP